jgi:hypothetical protein
MKKVREMSMMMNSFGLLVAGFLPCRDPSAGRKPTHASVT